MFTHAFTARLILILFLMAAAVACTGTTEPNVPVGRVTTLLPIAASTITSAVTLPVAAWIAPGEGPVPGTQLSYALSTGEEVGTHGGIDFETLELAAASFAAGEPITIRVDSTAVTAFRVQIVDSHPTGGRTVHSLSAVGQTDGTGVMFTLEQPGYEENQFLRVRLDFNGPIPGMVEYAWRLIPNAASSPLPPTRIVAEEVLPTCTLPSEPPTATATPADDPDWAQLLQDTAPETLATQADLIVIGTVDTAATARRSWISPFTFGLTLGIVTDTAVHISCTLYGTTPNPTLLVRSEGGCLNDEEMGGELCMAVSHGAQLVAEQQVLLFLKPEGPEYETLQGEDGRYTVQSFPATYRIIAEDGMYLINGDQASATPRHAYSLAELLQRIAHAVPQP